MPLALGWTDHHADRVFNGRANNAVSLALTFIGQADCPESDSTTSRARSAVCIVF